MKSYTSENIYKFLYTFKGRIIIAGLNGAACVSEYSPGQELVFTDDEVPTFFTKEECVKILKKLLNDNELLAKYTTSFNSKVENLFEDRKNFLPIFNAIEKIEKRKVKLFNIPYWYLRISTKNILLRNIKLPNIIKSIYQFHMIFSITKNSNIFIKLLVILESIINIFWYSLLFTLKSKK